VGSVVEAELKLKNEGKQTMTASKRTAQGTRKTQSGSTQWGRARKRNEKEQHCDPRERIILDKGATRDISPESGP